MRIALAADHAGFSLKVDIRQWLLAAGHDIADLGTQSPDLADDYPDYARALAVEIINSRADRGILLCGSGVGASIAANKVPGIRAGMCHDHYSAAQGVEHDDMNILVLGARVIGVETARDLVATFLAARYSGEERHVRRVAKIRELELHPPHPDSAPRG